MEPWSKEVKAKIDEARNAIIAVQDEITDRKNEYEARLESERFEDEEDKELIAELEDDIEYLDECVQTLERAEDEISRL